jgi:hypothetical protein
MKHVGQLAGHDSIWDTIRRAAASLAAEEPILDSLAQASMRPAARQRRRSGDVQAGSRSHTATRSAADVKRRDSLKLDNASTVFVINTEGAPDPPRYCELVGAGPDAVDPCCEPHCHSSVMSAIPRYTFQGDHLVCRSG